MLTLLRLARFSLSCFQSHGLFFNDLNIVKSIVQQLRISATISVFVICHDIYSVLKPLSKQLCIF